MVWLLFAMYSCYKSGFFGLFDMALTKNEISPEGYAGVYLGKWIITFWLLGLQVILKTHCIDLILL